MIRLEHLAELEEVYAHQSITKAAQKLGISQPALSRSVNRLSKDIGIEIFKPLSYGVEFTEVGQRVVRQARRILQEVEALSALDKRDENAVVVITLTTGPTFYDLLAAEAIMKFAQLYPKGNLRLEENSTADILTLVAQGKSDLGIVTVAEDKQKVMEEKFSAYNLNFSEIMPWEYALFVSAESRLADRQKIPLAEISEKVRLIDYEGHWENIFQKIGFPLTKKPVQVWNRETQKQLVSKDFGGAILPDLYGENDVYVREGLLRKVPISRYDSLVKQMAYLVYPNRGPLSIIEQDILQMLREIYA